MLNGSWCLAIAALFFFSGPVAAEEAASVRTGSYRFTYDRVDLPGGERLGLAGAGYRLDVSESVSIGAAVYGALSGDRGGLFTAGFDAGVTPRLQGGLFLDAGLFVGGGGGSSAPQGGGLMVRTHAGLLYDLESFRIGVQYAGVRFPSGHIRSGGAALLMELPFDAVRVPAGRRGDPGPGEYTMPAQQGIGTVREYSAARYQFIMPFEGVFRKGSTQQSGRFALAGFEYGRSVGGRVGLFVETAGAAGGDADGYAELLAGVCYDVPLFGQEASRGRTAGLLLQGRVSAGAGGGGAMDTGGGAMVKSGIGIVYAVPGGLLVSAAYGTVDALEGPFRGEFALAQAGLVHDLVVANGWGARQLAPDDRLTPMNWRVRSAHQTYTTIDGSMRFSGRDRTLSLLGIKADRGLSEHLYLTGQVLSAYDGEAGGYTAGLMGFGMGSRIGSSSTGVFIEALLGAAGGGGIEVGGGTVVQPNIGIWLDLGEVFQIETSVGRIMATTGRLNSTVADLSIAYRFSTLVLP